MYVVDRGGLRKSSASPCTGGAAAYVHSVQAHPIVLPSTGVKAEGFFNMEPL